MTAAKSTKSTKSAPADAAAERETARLDALYKQGENNADIIKAAGIVNGMSPETIKARIIQAMGG